MELELLKQENGYELKVGSGGIKGSSIEELTEIVGMMAIYLEELESNSVQAQGVRSGAWPRIRKEHLEEHNSCEACGCKKSISVHHILPFYKNPDLELLKDNLITLCFICHFWLAHLKNWKSYNVHIRRDAKWYKEKINERPI